MFSFAIEGDDRLPCTIRCQTQVGDGERTRNLLLITPRRFLGFPRASTSVFTVYSEHHLLLHTYIHILSIQNVSHLSCGQKATWTFVTASQIANNSTPYHIRISLRLPTYLSNVSICLKPVPDKQHLESESCDIIYPSEVEEVQRLYTIQTQFQEISRGKPELIALHISYRCLLTLPSEYYKDRGELSLTTKEESVPNPFIKPTSITKGESERKAVTQNRYLSKGQQLRPEKAVAPLKTMRVFKPCFCAHPVAVAVLYHTQN